MIALYSLVMYLVSAVIALANAVRLPRLLPRQSKLRQFIEGQKGAGATLPPTATVVWVHAASLGEYGVVRPIMRALRKEGAYIVLTFFSPTGVTALSNMAAAQRAADKVLYLPIDTPRHARQFVATLRPTRAIVAVSDLWVNHLRALHARQIPTFLVAAKVTPQSAAARWYGALSRYALRLFTTIMVLDDASAAILRQHAITTNVVLVGDPLFDNALLTAQTPFADDIIEAFCHDQRVMIAGSIHDKKDIALVATLVNTFPSDRFLLVPHEVGAAFIATLRGALATDSIIYSSTTAAAAATARVLIVDTVGMLARLYRYGAMAYVGGGFTSKLHSIIEPVVYGLPVAFGPRHHRKATPAALISGGIGTVVTTAAELTAWYGALRTDAARRAEIARAATAYSHQQSGATDTIVTLLSPPCHA